MLLNLDKWPGDSVAAIDSQGGQLAYGELREFGKSLAQWLPGRSLLFLLVENNVGGIAGMARDCTISGVVTSGYITDAKASGNVGGVVGYMEKTNTGSMELTKVVSTAFVGCTATSRSGALSASTGVRYS